MKMVTRNKDYGREVDLDRFRQRRRKWWILLPLLVLVAVGLWYGVTILLAVKNATITNTNPGLAILKKKTAEKPQQINVLLIGVGGESHPGGTLADSIMVASINPQTKSVSLLSIPRDLYVTIPGDGKDKINASHSFGESTKGKGGGPAVLKEVVSTVLGVPIHYFVRVDFDGFKKIIDTVGGVTVDVKKAINDPLYPDTQMKGYDPFSITAGTHTLDGKTALKYVRSRETTSDFDRARRQQQVLSAVKDKVLSAQVLANPKKVTDIITVLGKHILTDFSPSEIDQLISLAKDMNNPTISSYVIDNSEGGLLVSGRAPNGGSILMPKAGMNDFSEIQLFAQSYFAAPQIKAEKASIQIERAGTSKELATKVEKQLETAGFTVTLLEESSPSPTSSPSTTESATSLVYDQSGGSKPVALSLLKDIYHLKVSESRKNATSSPSSTTSTPDFRLILAPDFQKIVKATPKATQPTVSPPLLSDIKKEEGAVQQVTQ